MHSPDAPSMNTGGKETGFGQPLSRRAALGRLAGFAAGSFLLGCAPVRVALKWYPDEFKRRDICDRLLRGFITTVIPGAPADAPELTRAFFDPYYPFAPHVGFFVSDLAKRSAALLGTDRFDVLSLADRTRVVDAGLAADAVTRRLYSGALLLAQVSFYAGIYDPAQGCALIGFEGEFRMRAPEELTYPQQTRFLGRSATATGNPS